MSLGPKGEKKIYDLAEARLKIRAYCLYRERSQREVREKLHSYGLLETATEELISELIQERYLDEERFARAFVRGKFYLKKWGRRKIQAALQRHALSDYVLRQAFSEIEEEDYRASLEAQADRYWPKTAGLKDFERRQKLAAYLIRRGYESGAVWDFLADYQAPEEA